MGKTGELTEDYWLEAFHNGDQRVLEYLIQLHSKALVYYANQLVQDKSEAEDIVSKCFLKLWQRNTDFKTMNNIKAFLYISIRHSCLDYLASLKVRSKIQEGYLHQLVSEGNHYLTPDTDKIDYEIIESETLNLMYLEIEKLPKKMRVIFKLLFIEGKSTEEIAGELNLSVQTVRNQKTNALQIIKKSLLKKGVSAIMQAALLTLIKNT